MLISSPPSLTTAPRATRTARRLLRDILGWYFDNYYGKVEGPGCLPFYCDPARVGPFAVAPAELAAGKPKAIFRLAVGLTMFQARKDIDIMAIQRDMRPSLAARLTDAAGLRRRLARVPCPHATNGPTLATGCDVQKAEGKADCATRPGTRCPVKEAALAFRRYSDFGKVPFSLALLAEAEGVPSFAGLYKHALAIHADPLDRAIWLETTLCRGWRVSTKIADFILSALTNPDLTPGLHPWREGVDWTHFVVIDRHVERALAMLGAPATSSYEVLRRWLFELARQVDLRQFHAHVAAYNPRLLQQALYRFLSVANRQATPEDCCHAGQAACERCPAVIRRACPLART